SPSDQRGIVRALCDPVRRRLDTRLPTGAAQETPAPGPPPSARIRRMPAAHLGLRLDDRLYLDVPGNNAVEASAPQPGGLRDLAGRRRPPRWLQRPVGLGDDGGVRHLAIATDLDRSARAPDGGRLGRCRRAQRGIPALLDL